MNTPSPTWTVFERGWLSSNNVLFIGSDSTALVDTGYCSHAPQTLALVRAQLDERALDHIINTHLHSDHCGGNAALQSNYGAALTTHIPCGLATAVASWDEAQLSYQATGQNCPRFRFDRTMQHGSALRLGDVDWELHAAPGHDPHSIILFEPQSRTLISADALWENGFGVIFPELEGRGNHGVNAFDDVAQTLDAIERLAPQTVIPGHGAVFGGARVSAALTTARRRLNGFVQSPLKHTHYAVKVLLKYKLLEFGRIEESAFMRWANATPYFETVHQQWFADTPIDAWLAAYLGELISSGAAKREGAWICNV